MALDPSENKDGPITIELLPKEAAAIQTSMILAMEVMAQTPGGSSVGNKIVYSQVAVKLIEAMLAQTVMGTVPNQEMLDYLAEIKAAIVEMETTGEHPKMKEDSVLLGSTPTLGTNPKGPHF